LERHPAKTRVIHWTVAISFILALLSGLAIYTSWLYHWLTPLFGGGPMTRLLHPWFGLIFGIAFLFELFNWKGLMAWTPKDREWMGRMKEYLSNKEGREPDYVGFFNGGQKMYFWTIFACTIVFIVTGVLMWFPEVFGRTLTAVSYVLHDLAALVMLAGFIVHIYEGTAAAPGTFHSMIGGTVTRSWAWTHHPAWYREASGPDHTRGRTSAEQGPAPPGA
jgi:formate dehydrogenase subunit gamma